MMEEKAYGTRSQSVLAACTIEPSFAIIVKAVVRKVMAVEKKVGGRKIKREFLFERFPVKISRDEKFKKNFLKFLKTFQPLSL
jgi:hypothetical protein